jgi:hypothetical protein
MGRRNICNLQVDVLYSMQDAGARKERSLGAIPISEHFHPSTWWHKFGFMPGKRIGPRIGSNVNNVFLNL